METPGNQYTEFAKLPSYEFQKIRKGFKEG